MAELFRMWSPRGQRWLAKNRTVIYPVLVHSKNEYSTMKYIDYNGGQWFYRKRKVKQFQFLLMLVLLLTRSHVDNSYVHLYLETSFLFAHWRPDFKKPDFFLILYFRIWNVRDENVEKGVLYLTLYVDLSGKLTQKRYRLIRLICEHMR